MDKSSQDCCTTTVKHFFGTSPHGTSPQLKFHNLDRACKYKSAHEDLSQSNLSHTPVPPFAESLSFSKGTQPITCHSSSGSMPPHGGPMTRARTASRRHRLG